jgi:glutathione synthase/RimK-type ligase-like ATP-grasp enzyme
MPKAEAFERAPEPSRAFAASALAALWGSFYAQPANWMNSARSSSALEKDKVTQAIASARVGLHPIPTLFTTSEQQFRDFIANVDGDVAIKSPVSWHTEVEGSPDPYATYTRRVGQEEALHFSSRIGAAALLVQPYVEKDYEIRVTIVAGEIYACRIDSQTSEVSSTDWRHYDLSNVEHQAWSLPAEIRTNLLALMEAVGLQFACIDMIVEPNGRHRFVELNPSGQYLWIEALTGLQITASIASWLLHER